MSNITSTSALLIIGNEILSGRTKDANLAWLGEQLSAIGAPLKEVRVIPDIETEIINAVHALKDKYTYVFTTGGIGPTHDDITAECMAKAFDTELWEDPEARRRLEVHYEDSEHDLNEARLKMAKVPKGSTLIDNPVSAAPGFQIENVYVMAGVPRIMQAMFDNIASGIKGGASMQSIEIQCRLGEGDLAAPLGEIQKQYPEVDIGSYPSYKGGRFSVAVVIRHTDMALLEKVADHITEQVKQIEQNGKTVLGG